ncbi:uncharacterized protein LOC134245966 [Saccostrea cucullata]|uniref:uncharacterized protein LOC134245966 n=1 Tax=Saccostrea cuccullata TaxID=36930 RepID=UPI002ED515E2
MEYGSPEAVEHAMKQRIINFTPLMENDRKRYFDLYDLAAEVESLKSDEAYGSAFAYFDSTTGINDFVRKLPKRFREKWMTTCDKYKVNNGVSYVPFQVLVNFLRDLSRLRNDPGLILENLPQNTTTQHPPQKKPAQKSDVFVRKTTVAPDRHEYEADSDISYVRCPIHGGNSNHALRDCQKLCKKPYKEKIDFLFKKGYCLKCCGQKRHLKKNCHESVKCERFNSTEHVTILHPDSAAWKVQEGEQSDVNTCCTEICNVPQNTSKSCSKIVLVSVFPEGERYRERKVYCLIDDQSNRSLASPSFFDAFNIRGQETEYVLSTCTGRSVTSGRKASGYVVRSLDGSCTLTLPSLIECDEIPDNRNEIPSKAVARGYSHLQDIEKCIPEIDESVYIELLIGRDLITAHHVFDQRIGTDVLPFGQKLPLGWVIIGNVCLGKTHQPETVSVLKTSILSSGRATHLIPCESEILVRECDIFTRLPCDEKPGLSIEDKKFLHVMESSFHRSSDGFWEAPLPFREGRQPLPDNRSMALHRAKSFDANLRSNTEKKKQVIEFVEKLLQNEHAELAPKLPVNVERWYLPMFAVFHPKKPESIRVVFDSSAKYQDVSLNFVLLQVPDLLNSLVGILLRFRQEKVAITVDVQHMFYNFKVPEEQRCYLRFIWHQDNDFNQPLVDYQMTRHVFGNTASPAVANYGFRKVVETADQDVQNLIRESFYVDDGLVSCRTVEHTVDLVLRTKQALHDNGRIRLHKFASNSREVLIGLDQGDLAKDLKDLDLGTATLPTQRSLGLLWNTDTDTFTFKVSSVERSYTRRGLLSVINSVFDTIGFLQPVIIEGKLLLREMMSVTSKTDWDDPLPEPLYNKWISWMNSLSYLETLHIPRMYSDISFEDATHREVLVFADASKNAVAAVAYLKLSDEKKSTISFLLNSQVVLGYISNETRRFYIYVANRVGRIRLFSEPSQWHHVRTECNPADVATRTIDASQLEDSAWLRGPVETPEITTKSEFELVNPEHDIEVRPEVTSCKQEVGTEDCSKTSNHFSDRFSRFSFWNRLVRTVARIKYWARCKRRTETSCTRFDHPQLLMDSEIAIIACVQRDSYMEEMKKMKESGRIPHNSTILSLSPVLDSEGVLRVGGRLNKVNEAELSGQQRNPIILPKNHHVSHLLIGYFHSEVFHQGRHFTEGAVRAAGYWIVVMKRKVSSFISKCVMCRKLRGKFSQQKMADLPEDRCKPSPPFSYVGVDTFGPWMVAFRRTRGESANQKRWGLLFTCLVTRAIHIEIIEQLTSSSFINALRRFVALRGPVTQFRSDRGTNFVGASEDLSINVEFIEKGPVQDFLSNCRTTWKILLMPHTWEGCGNDLLGQSSVY